MFNNGMECGQFQIGVEQVLCHYSIPWELLIGGGSFCLAYCVSCLAL